MDAIVVSIKKILVSVIALSFTEGSMSSPDPTVSLL
jgi:hypothetical protein